MHRWIRAKKKKISAETRGQYLVTLHDIWLGHTVYAACSAGKLEHMSFALHAQVTQLVPDTTAAQGYLVVTFKDVVLRQYK